MKNIVAIISGAPINLAPYIDFYIRLFSDNNVEYILLNVGPKGKNIKNQVIFDVEYKPNIIDRIFRLYKGINFISRNLKTANCTKIVITPTRTAMRLMIYLLLFWRNKYIVDIRDLTKENSVIFKLLESILIRYSYLTFLSSKGFGEIIKPSPKVLFLHNIPNEQFFTYEKQYFTNESLKITSIGMIAYPNVNYELMKKVQVDNRIELHYYGIVTDKWLDFFQEQTILNTVYFHGKFENNQKVRLYNDVDLINCIYDPYELNSKYLTPNRLYDSALHRIPIIVSKNTYMESIIRKYKIGIAIDVFKDDVLTLIHEYVNNFNSTEFDEACVSFLEDIMTEQDCSMKRILEFVEK